MFDIRELFYTSGQDIGRQWWDVVSSNKSKQYRVIKDRTDKWKCSCPHWIYRLKGKSNCKHISMTKMALRYLEGSATYEEECLLVRYLQGIDE